MKGERVGRYLTLRSYNCTPFWSIKLANSFSCHSWEDMQGLEPHAPIYMTVCTFDPPWMTGQVRSDCGRSHPTIAVVPYNLTSAAPYWRCRGFDAKSTTPVVSGDDV